MIHFTHDLPFILPSTKEVCDRAYQNNYQNSDGTKQMDQIKYVSRNVT